jgi:NADH:ubiquinone oxidoreductase subunit F (NADH-binding)
VSAHAAAASSTPPHVSGLLGARAGTLQQHRSLVGPLPSHAAAELLRMVADSRLTGRGGGHFPTARKLALVAGTRNAMVLGNAAEGEPASSKDRVLLSEAPHLVLDGLALAGRIVGTRSTRLAAPPDLLDEVVAGALAERRARVRLVAVPEGFVTGQETAVVAAAEGGPAKPVMLSQPLVARGVSGRPALVLNVETLAHIALIARYGPAWFRSRGVPEDPGTRLVTISGAVQWPGVWEARGGSTLGELVAAAGGATEPVQAVLVGGYHGGWVPWRQDTADLPLTREGLREFTLGPGAGVVVALPARSCGLRAAAGVAAYLAGESAGQCGPCRNGLPAIAGQLDMLARGRATRRTVDELHRLGDMVDGRGACRHPDGTARFVRSTLRTFAREVEHHLAGGCTTRSDEPTDATRRLPWPQS